MVVSAFLYLYLLDFHLIYCRKTVIFLKPGVSHTKSVIIFHGASAILQTVELKLKMMIKFCSAGFFPDHFELLFHSFVHGFDFQF